MWLMTAVCKTNVNLLSVTENATKFDVGNTHERCFKSVKCHLIWCSVVVVIAKCVGIFLFFLDTVDM